MFSFWEEAEKELKLKKMRVMELHHVLSKFEADRTNKVRVYLLVCFPVS